MTRSQIIEVMARAIADHEELSSKYAAEIKDELEDMALAALTALESTMSDELREAWLKEMNRE